jgi:hypothetical protein
VPAGLELLDRASFFGVNFEVRVVRDRGFHRTLLGSHAAYTPLYEPPLLDASCLPVELAEMPLLLVKLPREGS